MSKKFLAVLIAAILALSVLAGCGKDTGKESDKTTDTETTDQKDDQKDDQKETTDDKADADKTETADAEADEDQFINTFIGSWPNTFDPATGDDMYGNGVLINTLEPLIRVDEDENGGSVYVPAGAESWEVSADGLEYTFHIRQGMKWSDGKDLNAQDYAYAIRRSATPETACPFANLVYLVKNGEAVNKGEKPVEELGVETPDDYTLKVTLENECPYYLDTVTQRVYFPQRQDMVEALGDQYGSSEVENIPVCGPFKIADMTINNEIVYEKNEDFWNAANVKLQKVNAQILNDPNTINNALLTGELDFAGVGDPKWQAQLAETGEYTRVTNLNPWTGYWLMNFNEGSNVANTKITRAIAAVLDREQIIETAWNGNPVAAYAFVPPTVRVQGEEFNKEGEGPALDLKNEVTDPKALFEEGCKELGKDPATVTIRLMGSDISNEGRIAIEGFQQQVEKALGCKVEASNHEWNDFTNRLKANDYDIAWLAWGADFNDPSNFLETNYSKTRAYPTAWTNEKFDKLLEEARVTLDAKKRGELLHEAERVLIYEDAALVPINHAVSNVFRRNYVKGARNNYFATMGFQVLYTAGRDK